MRTSTFLRFSVLIGGLLSASLASGGAPPSTEESTAPARLELRAHFEVPAPEAPAAAARDIRWATRDSIYLAYNGEGVFEVSLSESMPRVRELFPPIGGGTGAKAVPDLWHVAASEDWILGWSFANVMGWRSVDSDGIVQLHDSPGYFDAVDIQGDTVAFLGYPDSKSFSENSFAYLWLGSVSTKLQEWKPIHGLDLPTAGHARGTFFRFMGALRFLSNGDLLVVPVALPGVYRVSQGGKIKARWLPEELEVSLLSKLGRGARRDDLQEARFDETEPVKEDDLNQRLESSRLIIEDVVSIGRSPAVIIRYRSNTGVGYYLALLGTEADWYELPLGDHPAHIRLRADYSRERKELVVLATDRARAGQVGLARVYVVSAP